MVKSTIIATIDFCTRHAWGTIAVGLLLAIASGWYAARHFAINTDVNTLISPDLSWRQREIGFQKAMPGRSGTILVVVDAPTPEFAALAGAALADKLAKNTALFPSVTLIGGTPFFARNGLLFLPKEEVATTTKQFAAAAPLVRAPVVDPTLRGLTQMIALVVGGVNENELMLDDLARPFTMASVAAGRCFGRPPGRVFLASVEQRERPAWRSAAADPDQAHVGFYRPGTRKGCHRYHPRGGGRSRS